MSYPEFGTKPIRCGKSRCKWRGFETQLSDKKEGEWTHKLCPVCGYDSYQFMNTGEIAAWQRKIEAAKPVWEDGTEPLASGGLVKLGKVDYAIRAALYAHPQILSI